MPDDRASSTPTEKTADARRPTRPRGYPLVGQLPAMLSNGPELFRRLTIEHPGEVVEVDLGVTSLESVEAIVPTYLWRFRPYGQFQTKQNAT